ncbi:MAG: hypothetical protein IKQ35_06275 [Bacilli bacterium]|nr:hypothetical protein [Bacilli bacterium]
MKKIGIDIDGVLTDVYNWYLINGKKYADSLGKSLVNEKGYDAKEMYDLTNEEFTDFIDKTIWDYSKDEPARKDAKEMLEKLLDNNYELIIITARYKADKDNENGKKMRECVKNWLNNNGLKYSNIIFSDDKTKICKDNSIDLMIEDKPDTIINLSNYIPVICFNAPYNENIESKNIYRVFNWNEVYDQINDIFEHFNN